MLHLALFIISKPSVNSNWSYSPETLNSGQNRRFFVLRNLKFKRWPWKTIGHLFLVASSFVHHLIATSEFELELQSGTLNSGQNRRLFVPFDLGIWQMTLKNNRALLLCYFKLCAWFCSHWWIQTGATVRKRPIWVKIHNFFRTDDLEKQ